MPARRDLGCVQNVRIPGQPSNLPLLIREQSPSSCKENSVIRSRHCPEPIKYLPKIPPPHTLEILIKAPKTSPIHPMLVPSFYARHLASYTRPRKLSPHSFAASANVKCYPYSPCVAAREHGSALSISFCVFMYETQRWRKPHSSRHPSNGLRATTGRQRRERSHTSMGGRLQALHHRALVV